MRRVSSPIAACGVILVAIALGALASRHRAERPSQAPVVLVAAPEQEESGPLDVNQADAAALEALPRIGPSLARRIIEDRDTRGPFRDVDDLDRVRGIGPATVEAIRALVTAETPSIPQP
ncbi:MAG: helix-hairpin-helix domain-containing protein [Myxococcota bacterium]|nr:helix-hairpin-helix domain-containing protein [Myxococcota bacterium]